MDGDAVPPQPAAQVPAFTKRSLQMLAATRGWVLLAGSAMLAEMLLNLTRAVAAALHGPGATSDPYQMGRLIGVVASAALLGAADAVLGWYALRYARRLGSQRRNASAVEAALRAQHGYWRLQGALIIALIAVLVLVLILVVAATALTHR